MTHSSSFEQAFAENLISFPSNVVFRGNASRPDGAKLSSHDIRYLSYVISTVTKATNKIVLPDQKRFKVGGPFVSPKTIINFSGLPNASARTTGDGELEFHLGFLFAFATLTATYNLVCSMITNNNFSLSNLHDFKPPDEVIKELDNLMDAWDISAKSGWSLSILPRTSESSSKWHGDRGLAYILAGHELTHWFETIYKETEWTKVMTDFRGYLSSWFEEEQFLVRPVVVKNVRELLKDEKILDSWIREFHADWGALGFHYASSTHGGWAMSQHKLMHSYIDIAFWFSILGLFEVYAQLRGYETDVSTHPPAIIRRAMFCHVKAKEFKMSLNDFLLQQFGAGTAVSLIMDIIIGYYKDNTRK